MAKVECFHIDGMECWFYSQDHRPPHFHARKRGQWHFRVWFLQSSDVMLERESGPRGHISAQDRRVLQREACVHRVELLQEWERKVRYDD